MSSLMAPVWENAFILRKATAMNGVLLSNECLNLCTYFGQLFRRHAVFRFGVSTTPVQALHLICQNRVRRGAADENLKRIVLNLRRQRTADHQTRLAVI